jgi:hypothetical protein
MIAVGTAESPVDGPAGASVQKPTVWVHKTSGVMKNQWGRLPVTNEQFEVCCLITVTVSH